jgi:shikimate dehydrogenase
MAFDLKKLFPEEDAGKRCYGVVGWPLEHTLSPAMHNAALKALKIKDAVYRALPVPTAEFASFIEQAAAFPLRGFNVTVPYKERMHECTLRPILDASVGGFAITVNTMLLSENRPGRPWAAYSTDGDGFLEDLKEKGISLKEKSVVLLGAGGAASALLGAFARKASPARVTVVNRTNERALNLKELAKIIFRVSTEYTPFDFVVPATPAEADKAVKDADVVVNTTSVGLQPAAPADYPIDLKSLHKGQAVYDLIYHRETELMKAAPDRKKVFGGLGMLVHQGARSFEIWFNKKPPVDIMRKAAEDELKRRGHT